MKWTERETREGWFGPRERTQEGEPERWKGKRRGCETPLPAELDPLIDSLYLPLFQLSLYFSCLPSRISHRGTERGHTEEDNRDRTGSERAGAPETSGSVEAHVGEALRVCGAVVAVVAIRGERRVRRRRGSREREREREKRTVPRETLSSFAFISFSPISRSCAQVATYRK